MQLDALGQFVSDPLVVQIDFEYCLNGLEIRLGSSCYRMTSRHLLHF